MIVGKILKWIVIIGVLFALLAFLYTLGENFLSYELFWKARSKLRSFWEKKG